MRILDDLGVNNKFNKGVYNLRVVTVVFPGYSEKNRDWVIETANKLSLNHDSRPIFWDHWINPEKKFEPETKAQYALDLLKSETINIVAKSIGTVVAGMMIAKGGARIQKVILCGIPLNDMDEGDKARLKEVLSIFPKDRLICYQNREDPHGSYDSVVDFLSGMDSKVNLIPKERSDHEYPYFQEFEAFLKN